MVSTSTVQPKAYIAVLLVLGSTHLLNDLLQALIPAIYPIINDKYALDFVQIGLITLTFQIAGSLLQPLVGHYTDQHPMPLAVGPEGSKRFARSREVTLHHLVANLDGLLQRLRGLGIRLERLPFLMPRLGNMPIIAKSFSCTGSSFTTVERSSK